MHLPRRAFCSGVVVVLGLAAPTAAPAEQVDAGPRGLPPIEITTLRDPVAKSYRRIVGGMELFERRHDLAPAAPLRFRLWPRRQDTDLSSIVLRVVGQTVALPVPLAPDRTFALPRDARALAEDAIVVPDRRAGSMTWRADIRTPGLPPDTRRLGDLRLECLVGMESGLISNHRASLLDALASLFDGPQRCERPEPRYLFFADRALWSVTLVHGARRQVLSVDQLYAGISRDPMTADDLRHCDCEVLLDRAYFAPLGDASWPDDTLLELEYVDAPPDAARRLSTVPSMTDAAQRIATVASMTEIAQTLVGHHRDDVLAALGPATVIRLDSGHEVWLYRFAEPALRTAPRDPAGPASKAAAADDAASELVVLLDPTGVVAKFRARSPA
jgi:hypothetical protein